MVINKVAERIEPEPKGARIKTTAAYVEETLIERALQKHRYTPHKKRQGLNPVFLMAERIGLEPMQPFKGLTD